MPTNPTPRSSDRVLTLLAAVVEGSDHEGGPTLTKLAEALDLAPSTVSRQLASLEQAEFVERAPDGYRPGRRLLRLAHRVVGTHPLPVLAQPVLDAVAGSTGETAYLAVPLDDRTAIYVASAEGRHTLRVAGWRGRDVARRGTAVGRALSGSIPAGQAAVGHDTVEEGVTGVSAPVRDGDGQVIAALSLLGPTFRLQDQALVAAQRAVTQAAGDLGRLLGG